MGKHAGITALDQILFDDFDMLRMARIEEDERILTLVSGYSDSALQSMLAYRNVAGAHPASGKELKVMSGRFGPYVTDGSTHATLPKGSEPAQVTLDEAVALIDAKAEKSPARRGSRGARRRKS